MLPRIVPSGHWLLTSTFSSYSTVLYDPKAFFTHAALLRQSFLHCAIFPTAASRRSLGRVSVPVWLIILSDQLTIFGLVSFYLTNYLMVRGLIQGRQVRRSPPFSFPMYAVLASVSRSYPLLKGRLPTRYSPVRHSTCPEGRSRSTCMC